VECRGGTPDGRCVVTAPAPERRRGLLARLRDLDRAPGDPPALSGLDDLDPDMAELLAARDRRSQP